MGTWSYGIFDDDFTCDIRYAFEENMKKGLSVEEASRNILEEFEDDIEDDYYGAIIYLALAALGLKRGYVLSDIKNKALDIIDSENSLEIWKEVGSNELEKRKNVLEELRLKLMKGQARSKHRI